MRKRKEAREGEGSVGGREESREGRGSEREKERKTGERNGNGVLPRWPP